MVTSKTVSKIEISKRIHDKTMIPVATISCIIDDFVGILSESLINENSVKISSFGTFKILNKPERIGMLFSKRERIVIRASKTVVFIPSGYIKDNIINP